MELLWCIDVSIVEFWVRRYRILRCACRLLELRQGMSPTDSEGDQGSMGHRMSFVMGVFTTFAKRKRRDSIRQTWKPQEQLPSSRRKSTGDVCQKGLELQKPFDLLVDARNEVHRLMLDGSGSCFVHRPKLVKECLGLVSS